MKPFADEGWQLAIHGNGDAATEQVLNVYGQLLAGNPDPASRRWRI